MSVQLDSPELGFRRPFTHEVTQLLRIANPTKDPIAFKVKTTAPKQYCVRPNSGRIEVGSEVEVQVLLQAMQQDPPIDARCRDKFLVQSVAITPERDLGSTTAIWQHIEKTAKNTIEERKIRVVFLPTEGPVATPKHNHVNGTHPGEEAPPAYGSGSPYGTPAPDAVASNPRSMPSSEAGTNREKPGVVDSAGNIASSMGTAATSIAAAVPTSSEDLRNKLAQANATIAKMTSQKEGQELRQRKSDAINQDARERISTGTTGMGVQQQPADGVPVQIVAALCLLSFLIAYFFF